MPYLRVLLFQSNQAAMRTRKKAQTGDSVAEYIESPAQLLYEKK